MFGRLKTLWGGSGVYPAAPDGMTIYAIGDIHGRSDCLAHIHGLIDDDVALRGNRGHRLEIYVGDYIDRGPDSRGVIERLLLRGNVAETLYLRGNHEAIMQSFLAGQTSFEDWRALGGLETILSYGIDARALLTNQGTIRPSDLAERLPRPHLQFFSSLGDLLQLGQYCFVHAGLRPGTPLDRQSTGDLMWIRDEFLDYTGDFGFIVVHGHTANQAVEFLPNRVNIDTGAYATNRLTAIRIDADGLAVLGGA